MQRQRPKKQRCALIEEQIKRRVAFASPMFVSVEHLRVHDSAAGKNLSKTFPRSVSWSQSETTDGRDQTLANIDTNGMDLRTLGRPNGISMERNEVRADWQPYRTGTLNHR